MARGTWGVGGDGTTPIKITVRYSYLSSQMQFGWHLRALPPSLATLQDAVNHVQTNILQAIRDSLLLTDQIRGIDAVDLVTKEGASSEPANVFGTVSAAATPSFLMVPISFKSGLRQRAGNGRMLYPVRAEAFTDGEALSAQGVQLIDAVSTALRTNYTGAQAGRPWQMINVHEALDASRPHKGPNPLPAVPASWYDVVSIRTNTALSSVKRRRQGVGS